MIRLWEVGISAPASNVARIIQAGDGFSASIAQTGAGNVGTIVQR